MELILASSSPYRKELFSSLGLAFKVIPSKVDESQIKKTAKTPRELVEKLALKKAETVARQLKKQGKSQFLVIAADSIAALSKKKGWIFLDKPKNKFQARKMAILLKGKAHFFCTGLALLNDSGKKKTAFCLTKVYFKNFSSQVLHQHVESGLWKNRAGGYDIKRNENNLLEKYEGSYTNVMGLPLVKLKKLLKEFGAIPS